MGTSAINLENESWDNLYKSAPMQQWEKKQDTEENKGDIMMHAM